MAHPAPFVTPTSAPPHAPASHPPRPTGAIRLQTRRACIEYARSRRRSWAVGAVAQLGERLNRTQEADGSIPFSSTTRKGPDFQHVRRGWLTDDSPLSP